MPATVAPTPFGYKTTIDGILAPAEAKVWFDEIKRVTATLSSFGQLVDLRGQKPNSDETNKIVQEAMSYVRSRGMQRSAVVLSSALMKMQIMRLAKEVGMYTYERYFDASSDPAWEAKAMAWITNGTDPDA